jgi:hypothetical protein
MTALRQRLYWCWRKPRAGSFPENDLTGPCLQWGWVMRH